ncbi:WUSCHEL-related homeobox 5 [Brachypodium distachyon]|uniref:Homeobox domain-containing protein n=1 Tax=Brachypodium distachyon TaxID=15368 RepID=I1HT89_BRADI|nr:WUSCHEL-related homeobox 5 [Brachypodium distachyon]KQK10509.1 hypothetical protein BRADI_2g54590v3 [Brachypodium distachyon]|eukprot:XP_003567259.1 WUSCHEL-related homeobox 5 [Brachypodium distachyon]
MDILQKHGADARNRNNNNQQAPIRLSLSPPGRVPVSPPMSPNSEAALLANARWTPTQEQRELLEGLYRQGLHTPSAEQIQGIAARLRQHGPVEGKNVFYWFQNYKARQRQRQRLQGLAYFDREFRRPMPIPVLHRFPSPPATAPVPLLPAACNRSEANMYRQPSFFPQTPQAAANATAAHYLQTQPPLLYPGFGNAPALSRYQQPAPNSAGGSGTQQLRGMRFPSASGAANASSGSGTRDRETLQLFPLQPTCWQMREKKKKNCSSTGSGSPSPMTPSSSGSASSSFSLEPESPEVPFYDFFGLQSGGRAD